MYRLSTVNSFIVSKYRQIDDRQPYGNIVTVHNNIIYELYQHDTAGHVHEMGLGTYIAKSWAFDFDILLPRYLRIAIKVWQNLSLRLSQRATLVEFLSRPNASVWLQDYRRDRHRGTPQNYIFSDRTEVCITQLIY